MSGDPRTKMSAKFDHFEFDQKEKFPEEGTEQGSESLRDSGNPSANDSKSLMKSSVIVSSSAKAVVPEQTQGSETNCSDVGKAATCNTDDGTQRVRRLGAVPPPPRKPTPVARTTSAPVPPRQVPLDLGTPEALPESFEPAAMPAMSHAEKQRRAQDLVQDTVTAVRVRAAKRSRKSEEVVPADTEQEPVTVSGKSGLSREQAIARRELMDRLYTIWNVGFAEHLPGVFVAKWGPMERGQLDGLLRNYNEDLVALGLRYLCANWVGIRSRFFKGRGGVPSLGLLVRCHTTLMPEAQLWEKADRAREDLRAWMRDHPDSLTTPSELQKRCDETADIFRSLGAIGAPAA